MGVKLEYVYCGLCGKADGHAVGHVARMKALGYGRDSNTCLNCMVLLAKGEGPLPPKPYTPSDNPGGHLCEATVQGGRRAREGELEWA